MEVLIRDRTSATVMAVGSSQNHQYASRIYPSAADEGEHKFVGVEAQRHWHLATGQAPRSWPSEVRGITNTSAVSTRPLPMKGNTSLSGSKLSDIGISQ